MSEALASSLQGVRCVKKFVIGCGVFVLLLAICGGLGLYYFVYRPARTFVASMTVFPPTPTSMSLATSGPDA